MNNTVFEKLSAVLSQKSFYEANEAVATAEELVALLQREVPEATAEEIDLFLTKVSENLMGENEELSENDLDTVAGGFTITITVAGVCAFVKGAAIVGTAVGGAIWYYKHRKCNPS